MDNTREEGAVRLPKELIDAFNQLGMGLYGELPQDRNLFFSPLSIGLALSTLVPGARGATARELEAMLGFAGLATPPADAVAGIISSLTQRTDRDWGEDPETGAFELVDRDLFILHLANALFGQDGYPLIEAYREVLRESFRADFFSVDFSRAEEAAGTINRWVSEQTRGKIMELVSPDLLSPLTRLVLTNAVYFKAEWAAQFEPELTEPWPFKRLDGAGPVDVDMMRQTLTLAHWSDSDLGVAAVEIPYNAMSMLVLLPDEGRLNAVDAALGQGLVTRVISQLRYQDVDLRLPKFRLKQSLKIGAILEEMGLQTTFDPDRADFGGITDDEEGLSVSEVIHEARVEVDENGTEAAAATAIIAMAGGVDFMPEPDPIPFTVDRPFVFLIRDQVTGTNLFMGRVTDPEG